MNVANIIGRVTKDPEVRYTQSNMAYLRMTVAIDRGKDRDGNDKGADFPVVVVFGKNAENCGRYLAKGRLVGIEGRIQTGSYERNGEKVYTTEIMANRVEFLEWGNQQNQQSDQNYRNETQQGFQPVSDIPF